MTKRALWFGSCVAAFLFGGIFGTVLTSESAVLQLRNTLGWAGTLVPWNSLFIDFMKASLIAAFTLSFAAVLIFAAIEGVRGLLASGGKASARAASDGHASPIPNRPGA